MTPFEKRDTIPFSTIPPGSLFLFMGRRYRKEKVKYKGHKPATAKSLSSRLSFGFTYETEVTALTED